MAWARRHKYNAKKTVVDGITFASKAEAAAYEQLKISQEQGLISDLRLQPRFLLQEPFKDSEGVTHRAIHYVADFSFKRGGRAVVVDVKGMETDTWKLKKKIFMHQYPHLFLEVWK
jgi:Protein of unknown function (DUF1064)